MGNSLITPNKVDYAPILQPRNSTPGTTLWGNAYGPRETCTRMSTVTLFLIAPDSNQPTCSWAIEWINSYGILLIKENQWTTATQNNNGDVSQTGYLTKEASHLRKYLLFLFYKEFKTGQHWTRYYLGIDT